MSTIFYNTRLHVVMTKQKCSWTVCTVRKTAHRAMAFRQIWTRSLFTLGHIGCSVCCLYFCENVIDIAVCVCILRKLYTHTKKPFFKSPVAFVKTKYNELFRHCSGTITYTLSWCTILTLSRKVCDWSENTYCTFFWLYLKIRRLNLRLNHMFWWIFFCNKVGE